MAKVTVKLNADGSGFNKTFAGAKKTVDDFASHGNSLLHRFTLSSKGKLSPEPLRLTRPEGAILPAQGEAGASRRSPGSRFDIPIGRP